MRSERHFPAFRASSQAVTNPSNSSDSSKKTKKKRKFSRDKTALSVRPVSEVKEDSFAQLNKLLDESGPVTSGVRLRSTHLSGPHQEHGVSEFITNPVLFHSLLYRLEQISSYSGYGTMLVQAESVQFPYRLIVHHGRLCIGVERNGQPYASAGLKTDVPELFERLGQYYKTQRGKGDKLLDVCCALPSSILQSDHERTALVSQLLAILERGEHFSHLREMPPVIDELIGSPSPLAITLSPVELLQTTLPSPKELGHEQYDELPHLLDAVRKDVDFAWLWGHYHHEEGQLSSLVYPWVGTHSSKGLSSSYFHWIRQHEVWTQMNEGQSTEPILTLLNDATSAKTWISWTNHKVLFLAYCAQYKVGKVLAKLSMSPLTTVT